MRGPVSFLRIWLIALAAMALAVAGFNLVVDPYDVFGMPRLSGLNLRKPAPKDHPMLTKMYQEARAHPVTVVIGSSPAYLGIDPAAPEWPASMRPVYNFAIPGTSATGVIFDTLREAIAAGGVRNAVVFLDFQDFFDIEKPRDGEAEDKRRFRTTADGAPNPTRPVQMATDMFFALATMGALVDSVRTVAGQRNPNLLDLAPDGAATESEFIDAAREDGAQALFAQKEQRERKDVAHMVAVMAARQGRLLHLSVIDRLLTLARRNHVRLTLAIAPHHADALELYWRLGLWPEVERLKTSLAAKVAADGGDVVLWDFLDYGPYSTEPVPEAGDRHAATTWFWEPTHFKKALGALMLHRMFGDGPPALGVRLTPGTVAARNAAVRTERQGVVCAHRGRPLLTELPDPPPDGCGP